MFEINKPKIIRAYIVEYDKKTNTMYHEVKEVYNSEDDLVRYLARYHRPLYNLSGNKIPGAYSNIYMDFQALNGIVHMKSEYPVWYEDTCNYFMISEKSWIGRYIFFLDTKDHPCYDVRNLKTRVEELIKTEHITYYPFDRKKYRKRSSSPQSHTCYPNRCDAQYIHRARAAYGMEAEPEYRRFVKKKDKSFRSIWAWEDFSKRRGSGWKDNPGVKSRHQWERKAKREFEKIKKNKS